MALSFIGGALLGAAVSELLKFVLEAKEHVSCCKSYLKKLEVTLESIIPKLEEIKRLDEERTDRPRTEVNRLILELEKGKIIVRKLSKIKPWNYYQKYRYSKQILKLDLYLVRFFGLDIQAEILIDTKQLLVDVQESNRKLDRLQESRTSCGNSIRSGSGSFRAIPELPNITVGLNVPLRELKMELFRDDVRVLGLCAPGGCGKTTLASMLCQDTEVKGKFKENIYFLTISSSPNLREILYRLFEQMDSSYRVPEFQNDEDAVNYLGYLLKQKEKEPMLFVLDDVWVESLVQKFVFESVKYKMLVTSRVSFETTFDSIYSLKMLSEADALTLFSHIACPKDDNYDLPNEDLLNKIVKGCKGFPLALTVIAHSLRRQPARKWRSTERILSKGSSIFDAHKDLLQRLATSLSFLDSVVLECFLDLGCFPEDQKILAATVIDIWVELYELDEDDAYVNLLELSTRNLVNLVEGTRKDAGNIDGNLNELFLIQHDLLRDLAIHQSLGDQNVKQSKRLMMEKREDNLPKGWRDEEDQVFSARFVSICTGEMLSLEWSEVQFPLAEVLMLHFSASNFTLPQFMEKMSKLKVLIIANQGPHNASLCGFPTLGYYLSHLKRIRLEKVILPSLNEITKPFKNLQKISLVMCDVCHALKNCTSNISNMLPNLNEIDIDYCNDMTELPREICTISSLQKLSITNCHNLYSMSEEIGDMINLEVLRLHSCTGLSELPNSIQNLKKLRFLDISDCCSLEKIPEGIGELYGLKKIDMRRCSRVRQLPKSTMNLKCLEEVICDEDITFMWEPIKFYFPKLIIQVPKDNVNLDWLGFDFSDKNLF